MKTVYFLEKNTDHKMLFSNITYYVISLQYFSQNSLFGIVIYEFSIEFIYDTQFSDKR